MKHNDGAIVKVGERLSERETFLALAAQDAEHASAYSLERNFQSQNGGLRRACFLLMLIILAFVGTNYALRLRQEGFEPKRIAGVAFRGTCHPSGEVRVSSQTLGTISEIYVQPGDVVQKGQILLRMEDQDAVAALHDAELQRAIALDNLSSLRTRYGAVKAKLAVSRSEEALTPSRQLRDSPERAKAAYEQALNNYNRTAALVNIGVAAQQELDNRSVELRLAKDDLDNAEKLAQATVHLAANQVEQVDVETQLEREELEQQFRRADLVYQDCKRKIGQSLVRAPERAVVAEVSAHVGDRLSAGVLLARLAELQTMMVEVPVAADMISQLRVHQPATVQLPTIPVREVQGSIRIINPLPAANMTHSVQVEFGNGGLDLLAGQPAKVRFLEP